ncbi:histidine phosphatase family protein [Nocardioidaceae bacterium]|nr:histidine phosphatase family protein [Nocardioidaceae bacterium]
MAEETTPGEVWLVRHGQTTWSKSGKHTSHTDLELTDEGEEAAVALRDLLTDHTFGLIVSSPLKRARRTAALAGFDDPQLDEDLREWDYGDYEGLTTPEIQDRYQPGWSVWTQATPGGESADEVTQRMDRAVDRLREATADGSDALVFGHGHGLRALTARWLGLDVSEGRRFVLDTATVSTLGDDRGTAVVTSWNA